MYKFLIGFCIIFLINTAVIAQDFTFNTASAPAAKKSALPKLQIPERHEVVSPGDFKKQVQQNDQDKQNNMAKQLSKPLAAKKQQTNAAPSQPPATQGGGQSTPTQGNQPPAYTPPPAPETGPQPPPNANYQPGETAPAYQQPETQTYSPFPTSKPSGTPGGHTQQPQSDGNNGLNFNY